MKSQLSVVGTEDYSAPELKKQKYGSPADIWSMGCVLYEIMSLKHRNMWYEQLEAVADDNLAAFEEELRKDMKQVSLSYYNTNVIQSRLYSTSLIELVMTMLSRDANDRPKAATIIEMDLFGEIAEEEKEIDESKICVICLDQERSHACVPCGHKVLCEECAPQIQREGKCPICRAEITSCTKIFE